MLLRPAESVPPTEQAREYLFEIGPEAVPGIVAALDVASDSRHLAALAQLVGYLGTTADIARIEPLLVSREERVRWAATAAVERLKRQP